MFNAGDLADRPEVDLIAKEIKYSSYEIEHKDVNGTLKAWSLPVKCFLIDDSVIPPNLAIVWNQTSAFLNKGKKGKPNPIPLPREILQRPSEFNLMGSDCIVDQYEPYSEFTFKVKDNFYLLKAKTVLSRLEPIENISNPFGDPVLLLGYSVSVAISKNNIEVEK